MTDPILTEEKSSPPKRHWGKLGLFFVTLGFVIFICGFGYGFYALLKINVSLEQMLTNLQTKVTGQQTELTDMKQTLSDLQQHAQKSKDLVAEQEKLLGEWQTAQKGDLEKWYVAEAQYLVKLANDQLQFTHNVAMAMVLLQRADQIMQRQDNPSVLEIRKAIKNALTALEAVPQVDITNLYLHLSALNNRVDQLPLPFNPLKSNTQPAAIPANLPWWKAGLEHTWEALKKIVIVHYDNSNSMALVLPEEKSFLYQNLHAQFENAMWAVLHRNSVVYQISVNRIAVWVQQYFLQDSAETKSMLQNLQVLQSTNIQPPSINLSETLHQFDVYFAKKGQAQTP